ncbi:DUF222 domain-containing protein [Microbacterium sp. 4R-513]|uniref:HNH endonuclease signature motif containing protein n=1 Tax=Microbacterium sp. 4R-513 TaxID=2567934 RepID=UPI0013E0F95E|nr:HNH endonuclease signature motif containing protein [Microbacterium sp. 4R-513]QIG39169.1 DUF222 domain-containing protein [Microbacterium sp. 4R-513]
MTPIVDELRALASRIDEAVMPTLREGGMRGLDDTELIAVMRAAAHVQRQLDAVMVESVGEVDARSRTAVRDERLTSRLGCHDVPELVERVTRISRQSASGYRKAARAVRQEASVTTGQPLDPALPPLREALMDAAIGVDGLLRAADPLLAMGARANRDDVLTADAVLAAHARGEAADGAPPASADLLKVHAQTWALFLDQDGAEPRENRTTHHRSLTLGAATERGVPIRGMLLPDVAAQLQRIFDSILSPRTDRVRFSEPTERDDAAPPDDRTRQQKQHDALATALTVAAASGELPFVGGAPPTLIVSVRAEDLGSGTGEGHAHETDLPISAAALRHVGCAGVVQRVALDDRGRIRRLGTEERVFNRHQRRAIGLRDGGCIIPGCGVPAAWCEIHHVTDHALGGPTHTDNGVLLCWYHHRYLDRSGWSIRMNSGVPEVRAPSWFDPSRQWRPATTSKPRLLTAIRRQ